MHSVKLKIEEKVQIYNMSEINWYNDIGYHVTIKYNKERGKKRRRRKIPQKLKGK